MSRLRDRPISYPPSIQTAALRHGNEEESRPPKQSRSHPTVLLCERCNANPAVARQTNHSLHRWLPQRLTCNRKRALSYTVFFLIVVFSISSWIDMVGVFSELPLMVPILPEGWNLSVYFCLSIEIPFIAPLVIYALILVKPNIISFRAAILVIIITGITSLCLLARYWSTTVMIGGQRRSVPLLALVTSLGLVDSCSTVVFYPYMKRFDPKYMSAVLVGESLTGFIPAIMKLVQGGAEPVCIPDTRSLRNKSAALLASAMQLSDNEDQVNHSLIETYTSPRYSVSLYLVILAIIMVLCLVSFLLLELHPLLRAQQIPRRKKSLPSFQEETSKFLADKRKQNRSIEDQGGSSASDQQSRRKLSRTEYIDFMLVMAISAFVLWGLISAFYTYSILPFGFKITNNAIIITNAIRFSAVILAYKRPVERILYINIITVVLLAVSIYMLVCALYSPCPPLIQTCHGGLIAAFCLIAIDYFSTFMRSCVVKRISYHGGNVLVTCAMVTKSGVLLGAIVSTLLVQKTRLFRARRFCIPLIEQCDGYRFRFLPK